MTAPTEIQAYVSWLEGHGIALNSLSYTEALAVANFVNPPWEENLSDDYRKMTPRERWEHMQTIGWRIRKCKIVLENDK